MKLWIWLIIRILFHRGSDSRFILVLLVVSTTWNEFSNPYALGDTVLVDPTGK